MPTIEGLDDAKQGIVGANGRLVLEVRPTQSFMTWKVSQITCEMQTAPAGATCALRKIGNPVSPLIATFDAASGDPPIWLRPGESLTVEWASCTPGDVGVIAWLYDQIDPRDVR